jgi:hypothetical protein
MLVSIITVALIIIDTVRYFVSSDTSKKYHKRAFWKRVLRNSFQETINSGRLFENDSGRSEVHKMLILGHKVF